MIAADAVNIPPENPPRPRTPAPSIDPVFLWPTPDKEDFLFYVEKAGKLPKNKSEKWNYGDPYPDHLKYPDHKLIYVTPQTEEQWSRWYYASPRITEDDYNWEFTDADIGGTRFAAVTRTYLILRSEFDETTPAMGATMPNTPTDEFSGTFVLAARAQRRVGDELFNSLYVAESRTYVRKTTLTGVLVDEFSNKSHAASLDLYYRGEVVTVTGESAGDYAIEALFADPTNSFWSAYTAEVGGLTTYYRREGKQLTTNWYSVETVPILSGTLDGSELTVHTYNTTMDYTWPSVLSSIPVDAWNRRDGGIWSYTRPVYSKQRYSGPCKATVVQKWKPIAFVGVQPDAPPLPLPISLATPFFSVNVPATLHANFVFEYTNGTVDPVYEYTVYVYDFPATNYTDWPVSLVASDTQRPYKGGFLRETITIYSPT